MLPFRIKICGVTRVEDALDCARAGAEAIGLNCYPASKRFAQEDVARQIVAALPKGVTPVAVVVNKSPDEIAQLAERIGVEWVQLHGDETPEEVAQLDPRLKVILARRRASWNSVAAELQQCEALGRLPDGVLIDSAAPGQYGGSGQVADWQAFAGREGPIAKVPLLLAGGLNPGNVAEGIYVVAPWGVDTASGVESAPGVKDPQLVRDFIERARQHLGQNAPPHRG
jgi:phosphoribosylanthranilate isomerase